MASQEHLKQGKKLEAQCLSKVQHTTMLSAEFALDSMRRLPYSAKLNIYECLVCGHLHIGKINEHIAKKLEHDNSEENISNHSRSSSHYIGGITIKNNKTKQELKRKPKLVRGSKRYPSSN